MHYTSVDPQCGEEKQYLPGKKEKCAAKLLFHFAGQIVTGSVILVSCKYMLHINHHVNHIKKCLLKCFCMNIVLYKFSEAEEPAGTVQLESNLKHQTGVKNSVCRSADTHCVSQSH